MRAYTGESDMIGLEPTWDEHLANLLDVFAEVRRVLRPDGTFWLNYGDAYANDGKWGGETGGKLAYLPGRDRKRVGREKRRTGLKPKDLIMMPARLAIALQAQGWWVRSEIVWHKPNSMPESVADRPTSAHEKVFLLTKSARYWYDADAVRVKGAGSHPRGTGGKAVRNTDRNDAHRNAVKIFGSGKGANLRNVWSICPASFPGAHFATFPEELARRCIAAGCPPAGKRCDCDELIETPQPDGAIRADPTLETGRRGLNRERNGQPTRPMRRFEQRQYADQLKRSEHLGAMRLEAGSALDHWIRTDASGARPIQPEFLDAWIARGWLRRVTGSCNCPAGKAGTVLDPFAGAGTVGVVARKLQRNAILIEVSGEYCDMMRARIEKRMLDMPTDKPSEFPLFG